MPTSAVEIRLLGQPAVVVDGEVRPVTRRREQAILARLALVAPEAVPLDTIIEDVWGDSPPPTALDSLRVHVSSLRKSLLGAARDPTDVLVTAPGAYRLDVPPSDVDVQNLDAAVRDVDLRVLRGLLRSWPEQDVGRFDSGSGFFTAAAEHVSQLRAAGIEHVAAADIAAGRSDRAVGALEELVRNHPYREGTWALLLHALAAASRRTEALRAAKQARDALAQVGMEPGKELEAAEATVLDQAPSPISVREGSGYVDVDGSRIAFTTFGDGPGDLLFLHGGFIPFDVMPDEPRFARFLERLAARRRVILLDRRGIGMSDAPSGGGPVTLDHWVDDCRAVLDMVGCTRCLVLAHENGGPVALRLAAEEPERIQGLVLHSTVAKFLRSPDHPYGPTEDVFTHIDRMIDRVPGARDVSSLVAPSVGDDPVMRRWLDRAGRLGAGPARARQLHRLYLEVDVRAILPDVRAPVIVLEPARRIRSDPGQARYLAAQIPDAELQMLDSGDHLPFLADAEAVLAAVDRVPRRTRQPGPAADVLRAVVAVAPPAAADVLVAHGAEVCLDLGGAVVATFTSRTAAAAALAVVDAVHPSAVTAIEVADTAGTVEDPVVRTLARKVISPDED